MNPFRFRDAISRIRNRIKRKILSKIGQALIWNGEYVIVSVDELIVRLHQDEHDNRRIRRRDVFTIRNTFIQLTDAYKAEAAFKNAMDRLVRENVIELSIGGDGQATFEVSCIKRPEKFVDVLRSVQRRSDIAVALGLGSVERLSPWEYIPSDDVAEEIS